MANNPNITVFLPGCSSEQLPLQNELSSVLQSAGMTVVTSNGEVSNNNNLQAIGQQLSVSDCSVHLLFSQYSPLVADDPTMSTAKYQFYEANKYLALNPDFKMFIWLPPQVSASDIDTKQTDFINEVRNNVSKNMVFSNESSIIQLVDDIRSMMEVKETVNFNLNATDVFLISNQLDENEATEIMDMLSDIVEVENLTIIQDGDIDYSELCKQQIPQSKLAVIYYKNSSDWAIPFAQQVWKKIGGASSPIPILLIGDEDPNADFPKKFVAPKVTSMIVAGELIPLEIKVQYDKVAE
jgi:hypothetical protein